MARPDSEIISLFHFAANRINIDDENEFILIIGPVRRSKSEAGNDRIHRLDGDSGWYSGSILDET
ncbi:hypothetical protein GCM10010911_67390 [Paenibacillus nasutitermitis]|uniref:Uncharacterized protein n=1 Tax=Paenibacillus nasutitermitis TaxID=1652958 RepID=A0A917E364_9BACL|nr:hypothetical protein GCM10010911_67390 [Paenibacillus nasutitermitis]